MPKYYRFEPIVKKGVVYGHERVGDILPELVPLHARHWEETERAYYGQDMNPNMDMICELEDAGALLQFTARGGGETLIGQLIYRLGHTYQHDTMLRATEEGFYVIPEMRGIRGGGVALRLLNYAEDCLCAIGVGMICMGDKSPLGGPSLASLARKRGYQPVSIQYAKTLED